MLKKKKKTMRETEYRHKSPWGCSCKDLKWLGWGAIPTNLGYENRAALSVIAVGHSSVSSHEGRPSIKATYTYRRLRGAFPRAGLLILWLPGIGQCRVTPGNSLPRMLRAQAGIFPCFPTEKDSAWHAVEPQVPHYDENIQLAFSWTLKSVTSCF